MVIGPASPGMTGSGTQVWAVNQRMLGRANERPAFLDAGLVRTHATDRHPDAERGVDVPRRERRSSPSGGRGRLIARSKPGPRDRRAARDRTPTRYRRAL